MTQPQNTHYYQQHPNPNEYTQAGFDGYNQTGYTQSGYSQSGYTQPGFNGYNQPSFNNIPPQPPKKNTGIIVGIILGVIALIAVVIAIITLSKQDEKDKDKSKDTATEATTTEVTTTQATTTEVTTTEATTTESASTEDSSSDNTTSDDTLSDDTDIHDYDGTYVLSSCKSDGQSFTIEEMESASGQSFDMSLIVNGSVCTLNAEAMGYDSTTCKIKFDGTDVTLMDGTDEMYGTYDPEQESITISSAGVDMIFVKSETADNDQTNTSSEEGLTNSSENYDGTYQLTGCQYLDTYFTVEEMEEMSGSSFEATLIIEGNICTLEMEDDSGDGTIEIDGDKVTITDEYDTINGTYNAEESTITINVDGVDMIFEKVD